MALMDPGSEHEHEHEGEHEHEESEEPESQEIFHIDVIPGRSGVRAELDNVQGRVRFQAYTLAEDGAAEREYPFTNWYWRDELPAMLKWEELTKE